MEITTHVEAESFSDVLIDFSKLSSTEKLDIIEAIVLNKSHLFKSTPIYFSDEVTVEVDPPEFSFNEGML